MDELSGNLNTRTRDVLSLSFVSMKLRLKRSTYM